MTDKPVPLAVFQSELAPFYYLVVVEEQAIFPIAISDDPTRAPLDSPGMIKRRVPSGLAQVGTQVVYADLEENEGILESLGERWDRVPDDQIPSQIIELHKELVIFPEVDPRDSC